MKMYAYAFVDSDRLPCGSGHVLNVDGRLAGANALDVAKTHFFGGSNPRRYSRVVLVSQQSPAHRARYVCAFPSPNEADRAHCMAQINQGAYK